jgi:hypothetical protein
VNGEFFSIINPSNSETIKFCVSVCTMGFEAAHITMKPLIMLVVLCTAFFVRLNAAPVLPSGYESDTVLRDSSIQSDDEMVLALFGTPSTKSSEVHVQSGSSNEVLLNLVSALRAVFSAIRKESDPPKGEAPLTVLDGIDSVLSLVEKKA